MLDDYTFSRRLNAYGVAEAERESDFNPVYYLVGKKYIAVDTMHSTNDGIKITYTRDKKTRSAYVLREQLYKSKPKKYKDFKTTPTLKVGNYVRIKDKLSDKQLGIIQDMENYKGEYFKIKKITSRGYYQLEFGGDVSWWYEQMLWSDALVEKVTKKAFDEYRLAKPITLMIKQAIQRLDSNIGNLESRVSDIGRQFQSANRDYMLALEMKNKDSSEVQDEKRKQIIKDMARLEDDKRIDKVDLEVNGDILVTTKPLEILQTSIPLLHKYAKLPAYRIRIGFGGSGNLGATAVSTEGIFTQGTSYFHPHMSSGSGSPCMGNMAPFIMGAISSFEITKAFKAFLELLQSYNHASPYIKIARLFKGTPQCIKCHNPCVTKTCEECGHVVENKDDDYLQPVKI
jgi:hypothetical protein